MTTVQVALTVNGERVTALVEPRTHLGDFLREHCRLTGTHLGCEHGVCGSCTVLIGGEPVRSCLTYAASCDGGDVRTVEGFPEDELMQALREAFSREHALQCGFCTPGMLIAARDLVLRKPDADERQIRVEMSGNLCRCTGYLGIVNAIRGVIEARRAGTVARPATAAAPAFVTFTPTAQASSVAVVAAPVEARPGWTRFEESFVVALAPSSAWQAFADLPMVASCLPGAELLQHDDRSVKGRMTVKLGPIAAAFTGTAAIERDDGAMAGSLRGAGADGGTGSRTRGEVSYRLSAENGGTVTRVQVTVDYSLQGALAQFSRSGIAQDVGRRLVASFAANLNARLAPGAAPVPEGAKPLDAGNLFWQSLLARLRGLFRS